MKYTGSKLKLDIGGGEGRKGRRPGVRERRGKSLEVGGGSMAYGQKK